MKKSHVADIGVIGLAVMGENLVLNMESKGFTVACFNRTLARVDSFLAGRAAGKNILGCQSLEELVSALARPRIIFCMVKAGTAVDELLNALIPLLEPGDIILDGGNSQHTDTARRVARAEQHGLLFVGAGISGGEEGALTGPSIMPGGSFLAWPVIQPILQRICARTPDNQPCCEWMGPDGAGHFVKMVHNGIEYADMQLICEIYHLMSAVCGLSNQAMHELFTRWNTGPLSSYLIEITAQILAYRQEDKSYVLDMILDAAQQKGTGKWTVNAALELGQPLSLISEAVFARALSARKEERMAASTALRGPETIHTEIQANDLEQALYAAKIVSYAQGFALLHTASQEYGWALNVGHIARIWRNGCIIRSVFLHDIEKAFAHDAAPRNLLLAPFFTHALSQAQTAWRQIVATGALRGIPLPTLSAALAYYDGYRTARLPANLLQAQRDFFGAHTYERIDRPRGERFHTNWTGHGGSTASTAYDA